MLLPEWLTALVLGLVEGATEFLPISSTGHLIITADLLGYHGTNAQVFEIFIQLGAILAVMWHYRDTLWQTARGLPRERKAQRFTVNLLIAFIPAAIVGLLAHQWIQAVLFNPFYVAMALIVGGVIILLVEHFKPPVRIETVDEMRAMDALKVGVMQCFALIPGTSRSGSTIMGGMIFGLSRKAATEFSFFLAIPTMLAATLYSLLKYWHLLEAEDLMMLSVGLAASFVSGLIFVRFLLRFIATHTYKGFAWYRIVFGSLILWYFWPTAG
ncbi:undecaprenyl-diphosphate phosphatase [Guyparkeria hydrothermalis]|uniref:undecaprenyl-diphosphate phosphatase n=1 Tax=Guyparkeria hydrothermalis TaxID=923 RepID=UPI0020220F8A|nr:undecaprenyl-diphosphate phosphatase [Guyparkeria hydrothermalis]MCL7744549.1 undecaprenyl-diphosphate phosphatase [Guyparkeria hydrothermalis]